VEDGIDPIFVDDALHERVIFDRTADDRDVAPQVEKIQSIGLDRIALQTDDPRALFHQHFYDVGADEARGAGHKSIPFIPKGAHIFYICSRLIGDVCLCGCYFQTIHSARPVSHN
jgi:hypothetical protein